MNFHLCDILFEYFSVSYLGNDDLPEIQCNRWQKAWHLDWLPSLILYSSPFSGCLFYSGIFIAARKRHDKKLVREKGILLKAFGADPEGEQGLDAGVDAEVVEELCFLDCSSWLPQATFNQDHQHKDGTNNGMNLLTLITN